MVKHAINQIIKQIIGSTPIGSLMSLDQTLNDIKSPCPSG